MQVSFSHPDYVGYHCFFLGEHYYHYGDTFSDYFIDSYRNAIDQYSHIPFKGIVLDEFKNLPINAWNHAYMRERFYGKSFAKYYQNRWGESLEMTLFHMRYAPQGNDSLRIRAINSYFDSLRKGPLRIEQFVASYSQQIFGEDSFVGLHNTYHNQLTNDEIWATGCNWWELPRKYAQTDENMIYPVRLGMACQTKEAVTYDMFYHNEPEAFYQHAIYAARFGGRLHYHGLNDHEGWGLDMTYPPVCNVIAEIEKKINMLNMFEPALPQMDLLIVFGFPALCNWFPDISARNEFDINGKMNAMNIAEGLWNDGYVCALAPSDAVDDGRIRVREDGLYDYCGHTFRAMLYVYPNYAKRSSIAFLENCIHLRSPFRIIGELIYDFEGKMVQQELIDILSAHRVSSNILDWIRELPVRKNQLSDGCELQDGSVVLTDLDTILHNSCKAFRVTINGTVFEGEYRGVMAIKADQWGNVEKFACGGFRYLKKNGFLLLQSENTTDIYYPSI